MGSYSSTSLHQPCPGRKPHTAARYGPYGSLVEPVSAKCRVGGEENGGGGGERADMQRSLSCLVLRTGFCVCYVSFLSSGGRASASSADGPAGLAAISPAPVVDRSAECALREGRQDPSIGYGHCVSMHHLNHSMPHTSTA